MGLDYGTNSVGCLIVGTSNGEELSAAMGGGNETGGDSHIFLTHPNIFLSLFILFWPANGGRCVYETG